MDTHLAMRDFPFTNFPLNNTLGVIDYGWYFKAPNDLAYAYDWAANPWPTIELLDDANKDDDPHNSDNASTDNLLLPDHNYDDAAKADDNHPATTHSGPAGKHEKVISFSIPTAPSSTKPSPSPDLP